MAKKRWPVFIGLSVAVGVVSSLFIKKQQEDKQVQREKLIQLYAGRWWFVDQLQKVQHTLEITSELSLIIDGRTVKVDLMELSEERLVLRDEYGYHIIFSQPKTEPLKFYDEANDQSYTLEAKRESPE